MRKGLLDARRYWVGLLGCRNEKIEVVILGQNQRFGYPGASMQMKYDRIGNVRKKIGVKS